MKLSLNLRNWGPQAQRELMLECARAADASALDTLWLNDHVAVPAAAVSKADSDFATGIQVDILATLAFLAGATKRIGLGTAVLLLPYRPAFLTAKWVARTSGSTPAGIQPSPYRMARRQACGGAPPT